MSTEQQAGQAQEAAADTQTTEAHETEQASTEHRDAEQDTQQEDAQTSEQRQDSDHDGDDPRIGRLNAENAKWRTRLREQEQANEQQKAEMDSFKNAMLKALGVDEKGETDPEELVKQAEARAADMEARYNQMSAQYALSEAVRAAGADPDLTIPFIKGGDKFHALNPTDEDYNAQVAQLVSETVEAVPKLRATTVAPSSGNTANHAGTAAESGKITREDLEKMTAEEIFTAQQAGQLTHLYKQ